MAIKPPDKGTFRFGGFTLGIDNMSKEHSLKRDQNGKLVALKDAVNVDLDRDGNGSRRDGFLKLRDGVANSGWAAPGWPFGLCMFNGALTAFAEDGSTQTLLAGFSPWDELTFCELGDRILWSDGTRNGIVTMDLELLPAGVAVPEPPILAAASAGSLDAGLYMVTITYQRYIDGVPGEESGAGEPQAIEIKQGQGINLSALPQPDDDTIARINVYVTEPNGPDFYRSASIPIGILTYNVGLNTAGKQLDSLFLEPIPPANIYRMFNGRVLYAAGNVMGWSEAMRPTITHIEKNRQRFSAMVDMLEPITQDEAAGVWVAAKTRTFFLAGQDPTAEGNQWAMRLKHPYGCVPGSSRVVPAKAFNPDASGNVAYWLDTGGHFCTGSAGGVIERLAANRFNAGAADRAASFFRERDGSRHVITSLRGGMVDRFRMQDSMNIKVFRGGQQIE